MTDTLDIAALYAAGHPFAVFRLPGETQIRQADDEYRFIVAPWPGRVEDAVDVGTCDPGRESLLPWPNSTPCKAYLESIGALIDALRKSGGKCVRMRSVCCSGRKLGINAAVQALFQRYPDAFCFCYFAPVTGLWLGATPELLLDFCDGRVSTMALAGTRSAASPCAWDAKNRKEQVYVTDFIRDVFLSHGLVPEVSEPGTLRYGDIEHICTHISACVPPDFDPDSLLDSLSPTPAVAGMPRSAAMAQIAATEDTPRRCYAGWVAVTTHRRMCAFVNLRCAQLSETGWCIYAGGGITADSQPEAEWLETEAKAAGLNEILMNNSCDK